MKRYQLSQAKAPRFTISIGVLALYVIIKSLQRARRNSNL
jgi:hypothetical protein